MNQHIQTIGSSAFEGMAQVRSITFYSNINSIGLKSFSNMTLLNTIVYLGTETPSCGENVFSEVNSIIDIYTKPEYTGRTTFCTKANKNTINSNGTCGERMKYITTTENELIIYGEGEMKETEFNKVTDKEKEDIKSYEDGLEKTRNEFVSKLNLLGIIPNFKS